MAKKNIRRKQETSEEESEKEVEIHKPLAKKQKPGISSHELVKKPVLPVASKTYGLTIQPKKEKKPLIIPTPTTKDAPQNVIKRSILIDESKFESIQKFDVGAEVKRKNKMDLDESFKKMLVKGYNRHSLMKPKEKVKEELESGFFKFVDGKPKGVLNYALFRKRRY